VEGAEAVVLEAEEQRHGALYICFGDEDGGWFIHGCLLERMGGHRIAFGVAD
jgi:hypothetical protein